MIQNSANQNVSPCRYNGFTRCQIFVLKPRVPTPLEELVTKLTMADHIIKHTFKKLGVDPLLVENRCKKREVVDARRISAYLCLNFIDITEKQLRVKFGRDRSALNYFKTTCEDLIETDARTSKTVEEVIKELELKRPKKRIK